MAPRHVIHYNTLSRDSKAAIESGNLTKMLLQFRKLRMMYEKGPARTRGQLHRHVIAVKRHISQHMKQLNNLLREAKDTPTNTSFPQDYSPQITDMDYSPETTNMHSSMDGTTSSKPQYERDTLSKRWMTSRKTQQINTKRKTKAEDSLKQTIYRYYYEKLRKLTKITVPPAEPSYTDRATLRSSGFPLTYNSKSYEDKFRELLYQMKIKWKPRDYIQRVGDFKSLFVQLCTNIMDCIGSCVSAEKGNRLESMEKLDRLFVILRRFKVSAPTFIRKKVLRGGGPKKRIKTDGPEFEYWGKRDVIGKEQLSVPVIDSLSEILREQFKVEHGLLSVKNLYKASRISGPASQQQKRFNLKSVTTGSHAVQIHFCDNHYVTSEQRPSGIIVWDSLQTSEEFKMELFPQLRLTYNILSQYSDPPKGLIKYVTDSKNMQQDSTSCGIYAVLRAYFILSKTSHKINSDVARSYLSSVLENRVFKDFDLFSSSCVTSKMEVMLDNYLCNQMHLQSNKVRTASSQPIATVSQNITTSNVRKRGRPKKQKNVQKQISAASDSKGTDLTGKSTQKRGRPKDSAKYSEQERMERIRQSKLDYYHRRNRAISKGLPQNSSEKLPSSGIQHRKSIQLDSMNLASGNVPPVSLQTNHSSAHCIESQKQPMKRGRPKKYSHDEKVLKEKEKKLRYYFKAAKETTYDTLQERSDKHKKVLKLLRSSDLYKERERGKDKEWHKNKRLNPKFRDKEKDKDKQRHIDIRENPVFRDREREKDRQWHKDSRENPTFRDYEREKDKQWHKDNRKNPDFRDKERDTDKQWHKDIRENPIFRDKERDKDRSRHQENRSDLIKRKEENMKALKRKYGKNEQDAIQKYLVAIQTGPNIVCTCCLQLWFPENCKPLEKMKFPNPSLIEECNTHTIVKGREWLCSTCTRHLRENRIPPISYANGMRFNKIPEELVLFQMEERCVALRQPFFQIRELPNGGQKSIKGNVVNVPMDVSKTINQLPRNLNDTETIGIKFKKKVSYKKCDYNENIRPTAVINAARYLINNSELYKGYNVRINETWEQSIENDTDEILKGFVNHNNRNDTKSDKHANVTEFDLTTSDSEENLTQENDGTCAKIITQDTRLSADLKQNQMSNSSTNVIEIDLTKSDDENDSCVDENEKVPITVQNELANKALIPNNGTVNQDNVKKQNETNTDITQESDDNFSEVDEMETYSGNLDTMLDSTVLVPERCYQNAPKSQNGSSNGNQNATHSQENIPVESTSNVITDSDALVIAPGEGQRPIALFNDPDAEYLAFPSIYCGQRRPIDNESLRKTKKKPSIADIYKWELRAKDRRAATCIPNIFFKVKCLQIGTVENVVGISVRKVQGKLQPSAGELKTPAGRDKLRNLHEGVNMFRQMRNTPPYYSSKKKCLLAMVRQGGMPALFFTQSCADTRWPELLKVLGQLVDNKEYSNEELENLTPIDRNRLVAADPVTVVRYFENKCHQFQKHILNLKGSYRHFLRREFQHRGSPHSHEIHWIKDAPIYDPNNPDNDANVIRFIDSWISTEMEVQEDEQKYLKYQIHKHSTSCRKRGEAICRFGIPFFPMQGTVILKPIEDGEVDGERLHTLKESYKDLRLKLNEMGVGLDISHEQFLDTIKLSQDEYILTIRSSLKTAKVFYARKPNALRVNPYMKGMLAVIKANHDVQYPLDIYALVCYVADYLLKSQKGLSATLEQACMDVLDGDMRLKQQIRHIGYKLLSTIETSAPEACYYIMQIPFTQCSVEVVFIPTSPPEDRTYILKSEAELNELPDNSRDVLKSNIIASYAKRPKELQYWCLADYVSELTVQYHKNKELKVVQNDNSRSVHNYDEYDEDIIPDENLEDFTVDEGIFPLKTKCATFKKRRNPRVIRFVNYNRTHDPENYSREKLLLYTPWRKEELLKGKHESYVKAFDANEKVIRKYMPKYEKFTDEVREAEELLDIAENENHDEMAPNTEQGERDDELEGPRDSPEYEFFRPPKHNEGGETSTAILYNAGIPGTDANIETMAGFINEDMYLSMVRCLNEKQFQIYTHILQHISRDNKKPLHIFITGGAGVGKSMVLQCVYQGLLRLLAKKEGQNPEAPRIIIAAPTGKAAYLVGGNTIHSLLKILPSRGNEYIPLADEHKDSLRIKFKNLNTIIIDEVSMVGNNMLSFIHQRLQEIMQCYHKLFGGLNVILFGDLFQLRPVMDGWIFEELVKQKLKQMIEETKKKQKRKR